jgi:hypothetical protein
MFGPGQVSKGLSAEVGCRAGFGPISAGTSGGNSGTIEGGSSVDRVVYGVIAIVGLGAIVADRRFARASADASRNSFGRDVRPGSREHKFMAAYSRIIAMAVGTTMFIAGLGIFGIHWQR